MTPSNIAIACETEDGKYIQLSLDGTWSGDVKFKNTFAPVLSIISGLEDVIKRMETELRLNCKRCGYSWNKREATSPKVCPKCKTPYWDTEKRKKHEQKV